MIHKLKINLKQHTPLLHFQHTHEGATLRATEVKPKLDKFILTELGKEKKSEGLYNEITDYEAGCIAAKKGELLIGTSSDDKKNDKVPTKEKRALNYKMKITSYKLRSILNSKVTDKKDEKTKRVIGKVYVTEPFPLIMSNIGGKEEEEDLVNLVVSGSDQILIYTDASLLKNLILKYIESFFAYNNFGQRTSKGFGSYSISDIYDITAQKVIKEDVYLEDDNYFENISPKPYYLQYVIKKQINKDVKINNIDYRNLFSVINYVWDVIKEHIRYRQKKDKRIPINGAERIPSIIYFKPYIELYECEKTGIPFYEVKIFLLFANEVMKELGESIRLREGRANTSNEKLLLKNYSDTQIIKNNNFSCCNIKVEVHKVK